MIESIFTENLRTHDIRLADDINGNAATMLINRPAREPAGDYCEHQYISQIRWNKKKDNPRF